MGSFPTANFCLTLFCSLGALHRTVVCKCDASSIRWLNPTLRISRVLHRIVRKTKKMEARVMLVISPPFKSPAWAIGLFHRLLTLQETVEPPAVDPAISSQSSSGSHSFRVLCGCVIIKLRRFRQAEIFSSSLSIPVVRWPTVSILT